MNLRVPAESTCCSVASVYPALSPRREATFPISTGEPVPFCAIPRAAASCASHISSHASYNSKSLSFCTATREAHPLCLPPPPLPPPRSLLGQKQRQLRVFHSFFARRKAAWQIIVAGIRLTSGKTCEFSSHLSSKTLGR